MKNLLQLATILAVGSLAYSTDLNSADLNSSLETRTQEWMEANPNSLPHWLAPWELGRVDENSRTFTETDPPEGELRNVAEFERMESVLVRYPFGISTSLIAAMSQETDVLTLVSSSTQENTVRNQYQSAGVNMENAHFLVEPSDSYWTRDYGPWFVQVDSDIAVVNFPYNRPRPNDNDVPINVADALGLDLYGMNLTTAGGNWMCDGYGGGASSDLIWDENSSMTHAQIDQRVLEYLGIENNHVLPDPNNTYIDHIDCWGKFLDVDKVLIREVPSAHAQYDEIEATAAYFEHSLSSWGNPYEVYRVYTPNNQPYTNSLILNHEVFVPITGSSWDDDALAAYEAAMPGYDIQGFTGSWASTDALHCRTKGVADTGMLHLHHIPLFGAQAEDMEQLITLDITPCSGFALIENELILTYRINGGAWTNQPLTFADNQWAAAIPGQPAGSEIDYVLFAADASGRVESHPFIGIMDPHHYTSGLPIPPELSVTPPSISLQLEPDQTAIRTIDIANIGGGSLTWTLALVDPTVPAPPIARDVSGSTVELSPSDFNSGTSGTWDLTLTNGSSDDEWLTDLNLQFPTGFQITSVGDLIGGSGGPMTFTGTLGDAAFLEWHGVDASSWGVLQDGESASTTIHYTVDPGFQGDATLAWSLAGDEYGGSPHTLDGDLDLVNLGTPILWIQLEGELTGELSGDEAVQIPVHFDSSDLPFGSYSADLVINDGEVVVPVLLEVIAQSLDTPQVQIRMLGTTVLLEWDAIPGATDYRVEGAPSVEGPFTTQTGTYFEGGWMGTMAAPMTFYRVVAISY
jgi:agmatine deiminase